MPRISLQLLHWMLAICLLWYGRGGMMGFVSLYVVCPHPGLGHIMAKPSPSVLDVVVYPIFLVALIPGLGGCLTYGRIGLEGMFCLSCNVALSSWSERGCRFQGMVCFIWIVALVAECTPLLMAARTSGWWIRRSRRIFFCISSLSSAVVVGM